MYKYEYTNNCPEDGFYWIMSGDNVPLGISHSSILLDDVNWGELCNNHPGFSLVGPIPLPRGRDMIKVGRNAIKARADKPVKRV